MSLSLELSYHHLDYSDCFMAILSSVQIIPSFFKQFDPLFLSPHLSAYIYIDFFCKIKTPI